MRRKSLLYIPLSILITLAVALWGVWANAQEPTLPNGGCLTPETAARGAALTGWQQTGPDQWSFVFTAQEGLEQVVVWLNPRSEALQGEDGSELHPMTLAPAGQPNRLTVQDQTMPLVWLASPERTEQSVQIRMVVQLLTLAGFAMMMIFILALFWYKRQAELGYFLLYLGVVLVWGLLIYFLSGPLYNNLLVVMRLCFALLVLAAIWLSSALTSGPVGAPGQRRRDLALALVYLLLGVFLPDLPRALLLMGGMLVCQLALMQALRRGVEGAPVLLLGAALTTGARFWVVLPNLHLAFFPESLIFYIIRCARVYDLPFALGCMFFVCRRFALQFDRTEQLARELDRRVAERTQALTQQTEARKSMMLNIFHDLRSPLFAVSSGLETLAVSPQALPALLPALQERVEFLRRLTEDLFLAAKLEQKQILLNEDRIDLTQAAAQVCAACRAEADKKGVELTLTAGVSLPVWGDSIRLQQALQNLVTNAIHYTPAGGRVTVDCRAQDGQAVAAVRDTGCGIAPEDQEAVFDRYFHTTAQNKHDSTGLGLTIAKELIELHHGQITLQSVLNQGSCFTIRLPLLEEDGEGEENEEFVPF